MILELILVSLVVVVAVVLPLDSGDEVVFENDTNVTSSLHDYDGKNAMTAGPITLDGSVVVTIPAGSVWTVV